MMGILVRIHENIIRNLEQDLVKLKDKDLRQKDAYEDGIYTKEEYASRNAKLQEQICEVQLSIQRAKDTMPPEVDYQERVSRFSDCLSKFEDTDISASEMNLLLKSCIEKIIYHNSSESKPGIGRFVANPFELDIYLQPVIFGRRHYFTVSRPFLPVISTFSKNITSIMYERMNWLIWK